MAGAQLCFIMLKQNMIILKIVLKDNGIYFAYPGNEGQNSIVL